MEALTQKDLDHFAKLLAERKQRLGEEIRRVLARTGKEPYADILAGGQSQGFFDSIPESTPKMLFEVAGGPHDIANDPSSANGEIGRYGLSWMKVFLEGDERYRQFLLETPSSESDFRDNL